MVTAATIRDPYAPLCYYVLPYEPQGCAHGWGSHREAGCLPLDVLPAAGRREDHSRRATWHRQRSAVLRPQGPSALRGRRVRRTTTKRPTPEDDSGADPRACARTTPIRLAESEVSVMMPTLYSIDQAADILHCSTYTLRAHISAGRLRATKPTGKWLIRADDLEDFILAGASNTPVPQRRRRRHRIA